MSTPRRLSLLLLSLLLLGLAAAWVVPLPARLQVPGSPVVLYDDGTVAHVALAPDDRWRIPVSLDRVDTRYVAALVLLEDSRFWSHPGVDPLALVRAAGQNLRAGGVVSGASTITMQLVRVLEPRPRTLRSKAIEALRAAQLELRLSKREILEAYLSFVPYGGNVEGVESGALALFGHRPDALSDAEIALLLAIPQDPAGRSPRPARAEALRAARDRVAAHVLPALRDPALSDADLLAQVHDAPVPTGLTPMPRGAAHAARWLAPAPGERVATTLDPGVQALAERALGAVQAEANREGVQNAAVIVVEHSTGRVRALVGGFDFLSAANGSQIPSFAVARSPGSTLKPLLYAAAIDGGLALPETLLSDAPTRYGSYTPENYDGTWSGMVSMEAALSRSLNVPFVGLLQQVGVEPFLGLLRQAGVRTPDRRPGAFGLSLIVGGVELSPLEIAGVYTALAGEARPLIVRAETPVSGGQRVVSPEAAWLTRRALTLRDRPELAVSRAAWSVPRGLAWKTGTSFGNRDAWAVGFGPRYVALVWLGNLNRRSSPWLVGASAAGPVLFDLLEGLGEGARPADPSPPPDLIPVELCALSGLLPGAGCPALRTALAPSRSVLTRTCPLHQAIEIDVSTGERVKPACRAGRPTRTEVRVIWPADVARWLPDAAPVPPLAEGCADDGPGPRIVAPTGTERVILVPGMATSDQEVELVATGSGDLRWFIDGAWLGTAPASERLWWEPRRGEHRIVVQDAAGRSASVRLRVQ